MNIARAFSPKAACRDLRLSQRELVKTHRQEVVRDSFHPSKSSRLPVCQSLLGDMRRSSKAAMCAAQVNVLYVTQPIDYVAGAVSAALELSSYIVLGLAFGAVGAAIGAMTRSQARVQAERGRDLARQVSHLAVLLSIDLVVCLAVTTLTWSVAGLAALAGALMGSLPRSQIDAVGLPKDCATTSTF